MAKPRKRWSSRKEYEFLRKYHRALFVTCPKCGKLGKLVVRSRGGSGNYWQVRHNDHYCYIGVRLSKFPALTSQLEKILNGENLR